MKQRILFLLGMLCISFNFAYSKEDQRQQQTEQQTITQIKTLQEQKAEQKEVILVKRIISINGTTVSVELPDGLQYTRVHLWVKHSEIPQTASLIEIWEKLNVYTSDVEYRVIK